MGTQSPPYLDFFFCPRKERKKKRKTKLLVAFVLLAAFASTQALKWESCGGSALNIKKLELTQDPLTFPGPLDAALEAETLVDMTSPIKVLHLGSCTYDDICKSMEKLPKDCKGGGVLGDIFSAAGIPCRCPLKKIPAVSIKNAHADLPKVPSFIAFLAEGEINIEAKASDASGNLLGCVKLAINAHFQL